MRGRANSIAYAVLAGAGASALAACGTIDQAPLVYVSTVKVGASVSTVTAATPGFAINLGVDATDAAYVPVAFGRSCSVVKGQDCGGLTVLPLGATNSFDPSKAFALARSKMTELTTAQLLVDTLEGGVASATNTLNSAQFKAGSLAEVSAALVKLGPPPAATAEGTVPIDIFGDQRGPLERRMSDLQGADVELIDAKKAFKLATAALTQQQAVVERLRAEITDIVGRDPGSAVGRGDAYSVFGSFNATTSADAQDGKPKAALGLGKSFSTGIAAQLLTEGLRDAAPITAAGQCIEQAAKGADKVTENTARDNFLLLAMAACRQPPKTR